MIIACERCKTRFNVPDDKLGAGPVRMRCSKCDHTFVASAGMAVVTATASLPPTATQSMTPVAPRAPTPGPTSPFAGLAPNRPTEPFSPLGAPGATTPFSASPFSAPRPPTPGAAAPGATALMGSAPLPVTGVVGPFAGGPPRPAPDPFAALAAPAAPDPFASLASGPPRAAPDPFAALAAPSATPPKDPFAAAAPKADPFAAAAPKAPDPFGGGPKAPDPFASLGPSAAALASDPFASAAPPADPFSPKPSFGDLFGPSPVSPAPPPPGPAAAPSPFGPMATSDPFAVAPPPPPSSPPAAASPSPFGDVDPFADPPAGHPPAPPHDPFDDMDNDHGPGVDDDARAALFGITAPPPSAAPPPMSHASEPSGLELAAPPPPPAPVAEAASRGPSRFITGLAAAAQVALLVSFTVAAVVIGRGGSLGALLSGDLAGALATSTVPDNGLVIDDVVVARRETGRGLTVLVISGVVHHRGTTPVPAVVVEATVGEASARGQAWTAVTAAAVEAARTAEDLSVLQAMRSSSPTVSPGDRAPFVIVMAAPEGIARPRLEARQAD